MPRFLTAILFALCLCSCSRVEQARQVLHEADSLRAEGRLYPDSAVMAQTVKTLTPLRWAYPTQYANANYHYGRILRERNNQTEAMQCFINATHSNTDDHHLIGRVYSNIGAMCYYSENYNLAFEMFIQADNNFRQTDDTIAQFNAIYCLALASASQSQIKETLSYTNEIEKNCQDTSIVFKVLLSKSILYRYCQQYDSSLYYANKYLTHFPKDPNGLIIKAISFSYLGVNDSAVNYARQVMATTTSKKERYSALYVLSHDNPNLDKDSILILTSDREDVNNFELQPVFVSLAQAIQLLEQDINRKPDYKLFASLFILMVVAIVALFVYLKHRRNKLKLDEDAETLKAEKDLYHKELSDKLEDICLSFRNSNNVLNALKWNDYTLLTETINMHFYRLADKLVQEKQLNEKEVRLCVLVLIGGFSSKQMAELLNYGENGIRNYKSKIAKKIGTDSKNMREKLLKIIINSECD